ncbi:hypothetical protein QBC32DRAFT_218695, partial [Pseudoneurospora amorphoporcata]
APSTVQALGGRTLDAEQPESLLERACNDCGMDTGRQMDCRLFLFINVVRIRRGYRVQVEQDRTTLILDS